MAEVLNPNILSVTLNTTDWAGDDVVGHIFRAPTATLGGGVTITEAYAVNAAATGAGTGFSLQLENWGTAGTAIKASGGTLGASIGGTGDVWAANTAKDFTLTNVFISAGEYIVLRKSETNSSDPTRGRLVIHFASGE